MDRRLLAQKSYLYSHSPIDPGLCLFVWADNPVCASVMKDLIDSKLKEGRKIAVTCPDYNAMCEAFPSYAENEGIRFLIRGSDEYVKHIFTAGEVYISDYLPVFYHKRQEQKLTCIFQPGQLDEAAYSRRGIVSQAKTLSSLDELVNADRSFNVAVKEGGKKKTVLMISEMNSISMKTLLDIDARIEDSSEGRDSNVVYYLPLKMWNRMRRGKADENLFGRLVSPLTDIRDLIDKRTFLITDSDYLAGKISAEGVPCALFDCPIDKDSIIDILYTEDEIPDVINAFFSNDSFGNPGTGDRLNGKNETPVLCRRASGSDRKVLVVASWDELAAYTDRFGNMDINAKESGTEIHLLFRDSMYNSVQRNLDDREKNIEIIVRSGRYQPSESVKELVLNAKPGEHVDDPKLVEELDDILSDEWKRVLGYEEYNEIWATESDDFFWEQMYSRAPGGRVDVIDSNTLMDRLVPLMKPVDNEENSQESISAIDGKKMIFLGLENENEVYVSKDIFAKPYALAEFDPGNSNALNKWKENDNQGTDLIILNNSKSKVPEDLKKNYIEIRTKMIPFEIIRKCQCFIGDRQTLSRAIAGCLGKKIISQSPMNIENARIEAYRNESGNSLCIRGRACERF